MNRLENEKMFHRDEAEAICPVCGDGCDLKGESIICLDHGEFDALTLESVDFGHYYNLPQYSKI